MKFHYAAGAYLFACAVFPSQMLAQDRVGEKEIISYRYNWEGKPWVLSLTEQGPAEHTFVIEGRENLTVGTWEKVINSPDKHATPRVRESAVLSRYLVPQAFPKIRCAALCVDTTERTAYLATVRPAAHGSIGVREQNIVIQRVNLDSNMGEVPLKEEASLTAPAPEKVKATLESIIAVPSGLIKDIPPIVEMQIGKVENHINLHLLWGTNKVHKQTLRFSLKERTWTRIP
jgi:hypothetical protein